MCERQTTIHINEAEFIAEIIDPASGRAVADGETGELVLTNLGRAGWPVLRYRTGDLVTAGERSCACGRTFLTIPGGIIGRADDCIIIRGVNIYPSSIEAIVRQFEVDEFRIVRSLQGGAEQLEVQVEAAPAEAARLADAFRRRLGVRIDATIVRAGTLPRRLVDLRNPIDARRLP
jgi:phenylacetate-CoA ligase